MVHWPTLINPFSMIFKHLKFENFIRITVFLKIQNIDNNFYIVSFQGNEGRGGSTFEPQRVQELHGHVQDQEQSEKDDAVLDRQSGKPPRHQAESRGAEGNIWPGVGVYKRLRGPEKREGGKEGVQQGDQGVPEARAKLRHPELFAIEHQGYRGLREGATWRQQ